MYTRCTHARDGFVQYAHGVRVAVVRRRRRRNTELTGVTVFEVVSPLTPCECNTAGVYVIIIYMARVCARVWYVNRERVCVNGVGVTRFGPTHFRASRP